MDPPQSAIETYRYLRVGIVGLAVLLAVSVAGQVAADGYLLDSISAYYFSPVRDVLVGVLVAVGISLIALRGRGVEDVLLNLAGMLAPVVAFVPTPDAGPMPGALAAGSTNAPWSLVVVGALGVGFAAVTAARLAGQERRQAQRGVLVAAVLVLALGAWLALDRDSFGSAAHYVAAVGLFGVFVVVARLNAEAASDAAEGPVMAMLPAARRRQAYRAISWSMLATVAVAGVLGLLQATGRTPVDAWLFWVEAVLLALFAAFWVLQTVEHWRRGVPLT